MNESYPPRDTDEVREWHAMKHICVCGHIRAYHRTVFRPWKLSAILDGDCEKCMCPHFNKQKVKSVE